MAALRSGYFGDLEMSWRACLAFITGNKLGGGGSKTYQLNKTK